MRHHRLDIYDVDIYLATTKREWSTLRRRLPYLDQHPRAAGLAQFATWEPKVGRTQPVVVLWVDLAQAETDADLIDTIAHEAAHAAGQLMQYVGHDTQGTDEPSAYLVGWLARWCWGQIKGAA